MLPDVLADNSAIATAQSAEPHKTDRKLPIAQFSKKPLSASRYTFNYPMKKLSKGLAFNKLPPESLHKLTPTCKKVSFANKCSGLSLCRETKKIPMRNYCGHIIVEGRALECKKSDTNIADKPKVYRRTNQGIQNEPILIGDVMTEDTPDILTIKPLSRPRFEDLYWRMPETDHKHAPRKQMRVSSQLKSVHRSEVKKNGMNSVKSENHNAKLSAGDCLQRKKIKKNTPGNSAFIPGHKPVKAIHKEPQPKDLTESQYSPSPKEAFERYLQLIKSFPRQSSTEPAQTENYSESCDTFILSPEASDLGGPCTTFTQSNTQNNSLRAFGGKADQIQQSCLAGKIFSTGREDSSRIKLNSKQPICKNQSASVGRKPRNVFLKSEQSHSVLPTIGSRTSNYIRKHLFSDPELYIPRSGLIRLAKSLKAAPALSTGHINQNNVTGPSGSLSKSLVVGISKQRKKTTSGKKTRNKRLKPDVTSDKYNNKSDEKSVSRQQSGELAKYAVLWGHDANSNGVKTSQNVKLPADEQSTKMSASAEKVAEHDGTKQQENVREKKKKKLRHLHRAEKVGHHHHTITDQLLPRADSIKLMKKADRNVNQFKRQKHCPETKNYIEDAEKSDVFKRSDLMLEKSIPLIAARVAKNHNKKAVERTMPSKSKQQQQQQQHPDNVSTSSISNYRSRWKLTERAVTPIGIAKKSPVVIPDGVQRTKNRKITNKFAHISDLSRRFAAPRPTATTNTELKSIVPNKREPISKAKRVLKNTTAATHRERPLDNAIFVYKRCDCLSRIRHRVFEPVMRQKKMRKMRVSSTMKRRHRKLRNKNFLDKKDNTTTPPFENVTLGSLHKVNKKHFNGRKQRNRPEGATKKEDFHNLNAVSDFLDPGQYPEIESPGAEPSLSRRKLSLPDVPNTDHRRMRKRRLSRIRLLRRGSPNLTPWSPVVVRYKTDNSDTESSAIKRKRKRRRRRRKKLKAPRAGSKSEKSNYQERLAKLMHSMCLVYVNNKVPANSPLSSISASSSSLATEKGSAACKKLRALSTNTFSNLQNKTPKTEPDLKAPVKKDPSKMTGIRSVHRIAAQNRQKSPLFSSSAGDFSMSYLALLSGRNDSLI